MKLSRIYAIVLRNIFTFRRNYDRIFDAFYWPTMDMLLWGLTSTYLTQLSSNVANIVLLIVSGLTLWLVVSRAQYETNVALLEEIWSRNLINMFVSPLRFFEWIFGVLTVGFIKALITFSVAAFVSLILYKTSVFYFGFYLIPFMFILLLTGWWASFFIAGAILRYGSKVQTFAWTLVWIIAPLSGVYYPISSLPQWGQNVSWFLPPTYAFEGIREIVFTGVLDPQKIFIGIALNLIYLTFGLVFLHASFKKMLEKGILQVI